MRALAEARGCGSIYEADVADEPAAPASRLEAARPDRRLGSKLLKYKPSMCADCNNRRTQPYDRAWDSLHAYLRANWPAILRKGWFDLTRVFPVDPSRGALDVHLFFAKLYGCLVFEEQVPIDLSGFARSVYLEAPHREMVLGICNDDQARRPMALRSEIHAWGQPSGIIDGTVWMYLVSPIAIKVFYRKAGAALRPIGNVWHPRDGDVRVAINRGI
jgi:hypothetical protein